MAATCGTPASSAASCAVIKRARPWTNRRHRGGDGHRDAHPRCGCTASATSAYIRIAGGGLATKTSRPIGQRIRWARGMVQILRLDNPVRQGAQPGAAALLLQRHAALPLGHTAPHLPDGAARLPDPAPTSSMRRRHAVALYMLPHRPQRPDQLPAAGRCATPSGEVYETVLAWYAKLGRPRWRCFAPHKGQVQRHPPKGA